eukprot:gene19390-biopygen10461
MRILEESAARIGLVLCSRKCELIPAAGEDHACDLSLYPADIKLRLSGSFELLGAAVGRADFAAEHSARRVAEASQLMDRIGDLPDPQIALLLLRQSASFGKIVYSARVTPFDCHGTALTDFDDCVRRCFERFSGLFPSAWNWRLATLATRLGGLGLRSAARHAPAAYVASRSQCHAGCREIDPCHIWEVTSSDSSAARAVKLLNAEFSEGDRIPDPMPSLKQQCLSMALDKVTLNSLQDPATTEPAGRAHIQLLLQPGAGAWLHAMPSPAIGAAIAPQMFTAALARRLRLPTYAASYPCPLCDGIMDVWGDHAFVCACGGDRTTRHNFLRNTAFRLAHAAGLRPELEKPGLLRPRPCIGTVGTICTLLGSRGAAARRPADAFLPSFRLGSRAALDFAVTSGLRNGFVFLSAADGGSAVGAYEARKCMHLDTAAHCKEDGILFIPMVVEACGGAWGPAARSVWAEIA